MGSGRRLVDALAPGDQLMAFSHDGSTVAVGVWHASTSVFDVATTTIANARLGGALALHRAGRRLAVETENDVTGWDVANPSKPVLRFAATNAIDALVRITTRLACGVSVR